MKHPLGWMFDGDTSDYLLEAYASGMQRGMSDARFGFDGRHEHALRMTTRESATRKEQSFAVGYLVGYSIKVTPIDTKGEPDSEVPA